MRANVNKASKQAKRGECLTCKRLVQGKKHVEKEALLAHGTLSHFYDLKSLSESSVFLPHRNLESSIKNIWNINVGFWSQ